MAESFNSTLEFELLSQRHFAAREQFNTAIATATGLRPALDPCNLYDLFSRRGTGMDARGTTGTVRKIVCER